MVLRQSSVNLLDYGAIGNGMGGAEKDTQAFQNAVIDVIGGVNDGLPIFVPPGLYMLTQPLFLYSSVAFQGVFDQSIIQAIPGLNDWMFYFVPYGMGNPVPLSGSRNGMGRMNLASQIQHNGMGRMSMYDIPLNGLTCVFRDLTINHDAVNQTNGGGIWAAGAVRSIFEHVHFQNSYDAGLLLGQIVPGGNGYGNHVNRCVFDGGNISAGNGQGLRLTNSDRNSVAFCSFENNGGVGVENYQIKNNGSYNIFQTNTFSLGHEGIRCMSGTKGNRVIGNVFDTVGQSALHVLGTETNIVANTFIGGQTEGAGTYSQVDVDGAFYTTVANNIFEANAATNQTRAYFQEHNGGDFNSINNNLFNLAAGTPQVPVVWSGSHTVFRANIGYNPFGHFVVAVPASGVAAVNTYGFDCTVYVTGGTVSNIVIGGFSTGQTSGTFRVQAGRSITLTYTVAPTWQWYGD